MKNAVLKNALQNPVIMQAILSPTALRL